MISLFDCQALEAAIQPSSLGCLFLLPHAHKMSISPPKNRCRPGTRLFVVQGWARLPPPISVRPKHKWATHARRGEEQERALLRGKLTVALPWVRRSTLTWMRGCLAVAVTSQDSMWSVCRALPHPRAQPIC